MLMWLDTVVDVSARTLSLLIFPYSDSLEDVVITNLSSESLEDVVVTDLSSESL